MVSTSDCGSEDAGSIPAGHIRVRIFYVMLYNVDMQLIVAKMIVIVGRVNLLLK